MTKPLSMSMEVILLRVEVFISQVLVLFFDPVGKIPNAIQLKGRPQ